MEKITLYSIFHGRFPSEKAHSIFAAKGAEAFAAKGVNVKLLVPNRIGTKNKDPFVLHKVKRNFSVKYLFTLDLFKTPLKKIAFRTSLLLFSAGALLFILFDKGKNKIVYTNEIIPALLLGSLTPYKVVYELHDFPEQNIWFYKIAFSFVSKFVATNEWKGSQLQKNFAVPKGDILIELNAVEVSDFVSSLSKEDARKKLSIPSEGKVAVYTGHFYSWKGTETLFEAAKITPSTEFYFVGGTDADVTRVRKEYEEEQNIHIVGHRPYSEIALWQKAADVLVLPNTAKEKISKYYTSPMKLFEYMASKRPIVASDLPSVREIATEKDVFFVAPDDYKALSFLITAVKEDEKIDSAFEKIQNHTWGKRAERILSAIV